MFGITDKRKFRIPSHFSFCLSSPIELTSCTLYDTFYNAFAITVYHFFIGIKYVLKIRNIMSVFSKNK